MNLHIIGASVHAHDPTDCSFQLHLAVTSREKLLAVCVRLAQEFLAMHETLLNAVRESGKPHFFIKGTENVADLMTKILRWQRRIVRLEIDRNPSNSFERHGSGSGHVSTRIPTLS